jgi:hypothetical protein
MKEREKEKERKNLKGLFAIAILKRKKYNF